MLWMSDKKHTSVICFDAAVTYKPKIGRSNRSVIYKPVKSLGAR